MDLSLWTATTEQQFKIMLILCGHKRSQAHSHTGLQVSLTIGMPDFCDELHLWRLQRVVVGKAQGGSEETSFTVMGRGGREDGTQVNVQLSVQSFYSQ